MPGSNTYTSFNNICVSSVSMQSVGGIYPYTSQASQAWLAANLALYVPFTLNEAIFTSLLFILNGAVVNGNFDIGLYTGGGTRIISSGATAHAGINAIQSVIIAATRLEPGRYYFGLAFNNNVGEVYTGQGQRMNFAQLGVIEEAGAYPLPAVIGGGAVTTTNNNLVVVGLSTRAFV